MRFLKADKVFNGKEFLPADTLLVINDTGVLTDLIASSEIDTLKIERLVGILTPGFVNAHCHLELSHLHHKIPLHTGLPAFAKHVILQRNSVSKEEITERIKDANTGMWNNGIVAVGDISNNAGSFPEKSGSNIFYHTFLELIGLNPSSAETIFENGLSLLQQLKAYGLTGSLAPHAPYSTSQQLIKKIADFDRDHDLPLSIHNQESDEETKFMMGEKSDFEDLFRFLNLDLSWFQLPMCSALQSYAEVLSTARSLLVHNRVTHAQDLKSVAGKNIFWCFCPNANLYIENALPDFNLFKNLKHNICLGTDSLASNTALDLVSEANCILTRTSAFSTADMLRAMTCNGAEALGIADAHGQLMPGKNTGLNLVNDKNSQIQFLKKIN